VNLPFLSTERTSGWLKPFAGAAAVLIIVTLFLFADSFSENMILFSNDGPLGSISTDAIEMPGTFFGYWHDLNWLGYEQPSASPGIYMALGLLLQKSVLYLKLCTPICLIILGMSAWFFFRTLGLRNLACTIGAIAAAFNMEVVSYACWGLPSRALTFATTFLAAAFILRALKSRPWANLALAGVCVGLGLMEGYDIGALFSLYIAAFVLFAFVIRPLNKNKPPALGQALGRGERLRGWVDAGVQRFHVEPSGDRGGVHVERVVANGRAVLSVPLDAGHLEDALPVLVVFLVWHLPVQSSNADRGGDGDRDGDPVCTPAAGTEFLYRQLDRVRCGPVFDDH